MNLKILSNQMDMDTANMVQNKLKNLNLKNYNGLVYILMDLDPMYHSYMS